MKPIKAKGKKAFLCQGFCGDMFLRVYDEDRSYKDMTIYHSDLFVEIEDDDAFIYECDGDYYIDHSPQTLGIEDD